VEWQRYETYHQMLNGSSKRVMRIPSPIFLARSPRACFPVVRQVSLRLSRQLTTYWPL